MPRVTDVRLRSKYPCPAHVIEPTYLEVVHVTNGVCTPKYQETVEILLGKGYEVVEEKPVKEEPVKEVPSAPPAVIEEKSEHASVTVPVVDAGGDVLPPPPPVAHKVPKQW